MTVTLNHTIVAARDRDASAAFLAEMLGLPPPSLLGHFAMVEVGDTSLDFARTDDEIPPQHYAFLVSEKEFDEVFERIRCRRLSYWADPFRTEPDEINNWDDGRGVYFDDPNGHLLEVLTRPYGSAGTSASSPHPLVSQQIVSSGDQGTQRRSARRNDDRATDEIDSSSHGFD
jgi:catechol 2,3-dioxygenase-like lactoylglutathione lyase family enzyme